MTDVAVPVTIPLAIGKRGGRKLILTPDGATTSPTPRARNDNALLKALARCFRWHKLLETGDFATIEDIADAENINPSYVSRVLRLTLLAPEIVEAILAGRQPTGLTTARATASGDHVGDVDVSFSCVVGYTRIVLPISLFQTASSTRRLDRVSQRPRQHGQHCGCSAQPKPGAAALTSASGIYASPMAFIHACTWPDLPLKISSR